MGDSIEDLEKAAMLPEGDVIRILLEQHARIRELLEAVRLATGHERAELFAELRALLAVHETAEQVVLRPHTDHIVDHDLADARVREEVEATKMLARLEKLATDSDEFQELFVDFERAVTDHADAEEEHEFPQVLIDCTPEERATLGARLSTIEDIAPTRPHPTVAGKPAVQVVVAPVASIVDRVRDKLQKTG
jgi:hemerythrin superfamily protein